MKILLLGANGQVGTELRRSLPSVGKVIAATRSGRLPDGLPCEVANFDAPDSLPTLIERTAPDVVVNAAAYTAVDRAEDEPEAADCVNAYAPSLISQACAARDALLVHYSTDYVFDGKQTRPYLESDPVDPVNRYGVSKLAGERAIQATSARHLIIRTSWIFASHGNNFLRTMLRLARERDELRVVADQIGTPTSAALIADITAASIAGPTLPHGLWHLNARGQTSWHGFAQAIMQGAAARELISSAPAVLPIASADFPTKARRPAYSCLQSEVMPAALQALLPGWRQGMDRVLDELAASTP